MQIRSVEAIPATFADLVGDDLNLCVIRIEADGVVGWGEICDSYCCTFPTAYVPLVEDVLGRLLVGQELGHVDALTRHLRTWARRRLGDAGMAIQAISGIELALWDLAAKLAGVPVSALHGRLRDTVPVYASGKFLDRPAPHHVDLLAPALDRGVTTVKVRASLEPAADLAVIAALRAELGAGVDVLVDGNENFSVTTARRFAVGLADLGVMALEEPVPQTSPTAIARLVADAAVPIAYGEHMFGAVQFNDALAAGWPDIVQPDPAIAGGLTECLHIATLAEGFGAPVVPHSSAGPFALASALHLAACRQNIPIVEHSFTLEPLWEPIVGDVLSRSGIVDGALAVPDGPGWGLDVDEERLRAATYQPARHDTGLAWRSIGVR
ncbi:MAG: mandelate racemase/muconate lactonizing enzyme family protein [Actinomycetota bacterium]|nr:mandelate racemase/muconate lactonizing enzyme family protein [Actinomycetota bacterium]